MWYSSLLLCFLLYAWIKPLMKKKKYFRIFLIYKKDNLQLYMQSIKKGKKVMLTRKGISKKRDLDCSTIYKVFRIPHIFKKGYFIPLRFVILKHFCYNDSAYFIWILKTLLIARYYLKFGRNLKLKKNAFLFLGKKINKRID